MGDVKSRWVVTISLVVCLAATVGLGLRLRASKEKRGWTGHVTAHLATSNPGPFTTPVASQAARLSATAHYGRLPMAFEPNVGQTHSGAKFLAHGNGYTVFLRPRGATLLLKRAHSSTELRMGLSGSNSAASLTASDELPGKSNYIIGNRPSEWKKNTPNYRKVTARGIYPGIDAVYYGSQRQLEYDFVVAPKADPRAIHIAFDGSYGLRTDAQDDLLVNVGDGELRLHQPLAYQEIDGTKKPVQVHYLVEGKRDVGFQVAEYDANRQLIIDPTLSYSTYLGGSNIDGANAIAVASDNTAFIAGGTFSSDFPTAHALQPNVGGPNDFPQDAFVAKISADGSTLLYSTYLGGSSTDVANGIAVDGLGNAYVVGTTTSTNFPNTPGTLNPECGGDGKCGATWNPQGLIVSNAFITKLNIAGSGLIYSTYLGFYEQVRGLAIAVDNNENAYVTGQVSPNITPTVTITAPNAPPPPFPMVNAYQNIHGGGASTVFVTKISASGNSILYSSYLGGSNEDIGYGIAADNNGFVYLTGLTYSTNFPTLGALQGSLGGVADAFVAKLNTNLSGAPSLVFSTYVGGTGLDQGNGIALDSLNGSGNIYVTGITNSSTVQPSPRAYGGQGDAFALKLGPSGSLGYFTFLGGSLADSGTGIAADTNGNAYVTGSTVSSDFPIVGSVFQSKFGGGNADAFVTKINPTGTSLVYSTYLGGTNTDIGNGVAVDTNGSAYVAGQTCSQDFPLANPLQPGPGGNCDAFISKVSTIGGIAVNPAGLTFAAQSIGVASTQQDLTVTNTNDTASVAISAITATGDFSQTNACPATLSAGTQCTVAIVFQPTASGLRKGTLSITDNAPGSPQVVNLTGSTSTLTLSASNLSFGNQTVGVPSGTLPVTLTNIGATTLAISGIAASGDFTQTNSCSTSIPAGTNCVINVTYKPSAPGQSIGDVVITDSAPGSPQSVLLTGTGVGIGTGTGSSSGFSMSVPIASATVSAGQTATYALTITPVAGFSQPVALTCGNLPRDASCAFSPNPASITGTTPTTVTISVSTGLRTLVPGTRRKIDLPAPLRQLNSTWIASIILAFALMTAAQKRYSPALLAFGLTIALLLVSVGCGGGNQTGVPAGTPAGAYQVTVTGTAGSLTNTTMLNLQVN